MATEQELHDQFINSMMQKMLSDQPEQPTAAHTFQAIDAGFAAEDTAILNQNPDAGIVFESTFEDVIRDKRKATVVKNEASRVDRELLIENVVNDPTVSTEDKATLIRESKATAPSIINDPQAANAVSAKVEVQDLLEKMPSPGSINEIQWNDQVDKIVDTRAIFHNPDYDKQRAREGFFDTYVGDSLMPFELLGALGKDLYTKDVGDEDRFSNLQEAWETYQLWNEYTKSKAEEFPEDYGVTRDLGFAGIIAFDPAFALGIAKPVSLGVRGIKAGTSFIRTIKGLKDTVGEAQVAKLVGASHKGLVSYLQNASPEFVSKLEKGLVDGNPLTTRVKKALEEIGGEVVEVEVKTNKSPMRVAIEGAEATGDITGIDNIKRMTLVAAHPDGEKIKAAFETGELTPLILLKQEVSDLPLHPTTNHGVKVNNAAALDNVAEEIRYDVLQKRQAMVEEVHHTVVTRGIDDIFEMNFGINANQWGNKFRNIAVRGLLPKDATFKGIVQKELVDNFTTIEQVTRVINRGYSQMNDAIWKGLGKKGTQDLNNMVFAANEAGSWGRIRNGVFEIVNDEGEILFERATTPKVLDAYVARKRMMNLMQADLERSLHAQASKRGIKLFKGQKLADKYNPPAGADGYDIYGKPMEWTHDLKANDWVAYRVDGDEGTSLVFLNATEESEFIKDIPETFRLMPDGGVDGYMRIEYPDKYTITELTYATDEVLESTVPLKEASKRQIKAAEDKLARGEQLSEADILALDSAKMIEDLPDTRALPKVGDTSKKIGELKDELFKLASERKTGKKSLDKIEDVYEQAKLTSRLRDLDDAIDKLSSEIAGLQSSIRKQVSTVALEQAAKGEPGLPRPTLKRIATADTQEAADKLIAKAKSEGRVLFAGRTQPGQMDASYSGSFMEDFIRMDESQLGYLFNSMYKNGYGDDSVEALRLMHAQYSKQPAAFKPASALKARAEERLAHVDEAGNLTAPRIRVAKEADALYTQWASGYVGKGAYLDEAVASYTKEYGSYLSKPGDWLSPIRNDIPIDKAREAQVYQNHLKQMHNRASNWMVSVDRKQQAIADNALKKGKPLAKVFDEYMKPSEMLRGASALTTRTLLGGFSIVQGLLQPSFGVLAGSSMSVGRIVGAGWDAPRFAAAYGRSINEFLEAVMPVIFNRDGLVITKVGREGMDFLRRSGAIDGIDWDAMATFASDIRKDRGRLAKGANKVINGTSFFFTNGEKLNQAFGTILGRNMLEAEVRVAAKKGLSYKGLTLKDLENGGSAKFLNEAINKGKTVSLNMQRHNAPNYARDEALSLLFKFKEFISHSTGLYFDPLLAKKLSKSEFLGLWGGTLGALGPVGIPLVWDLQVAAELVNNNYDTYINDTPPSAHGKYTYEPYVWAADKMDELTGGFVNSDFGFIWLTQGLQSAMTKQQWGLGQRMMIGAIFAEYMEGGGQADDVILGAVYSTLKKLTRAAVNTSKEGARMFREGANGELAWNDEIFENVTDMLKNADYESGFQRMAAEVLEPIPGLSGIFRASKSILGGQEQLLAPSGKTLINQPSLMEVLQVGMGQTPASVAASYEYRGLMVRKKEAVKEWTKDRVNELLQTANTTGVAYAEAQLALVLNDLQNHMPELTSAFVTAYVTALRRDALDVETRTKIDLMIDGIIDQRTEQIFDLQFQGER